MTSPRALPNNVLWAVEDAQSAASAASQLLNRLIQDEATPLPIVRQLARIQQQTFEIERKLTAIMPQTTKP